jgi:hypothetical protein
MLRRFFFGVAFLMAIAVTSRDLSAQIVEGPSGKKLMVFGGREHDVYLGCLSCSEFSGDSMLNEFSTYGSRFSSTSIFNHFSMYGSAYSTMSACSPYASDPPVIVDNDGGFYGRLTVNRTHRQAISDQTVLAWLLGVCQDA